MPGLESYNPENNLLLIPSQPPRSSCSPQVGMGWGPPCTPVRGRGHLRLPVVSLALELSPGVSTLSPQGSWPAETPLRLQCQLSPGPQQPTEPLGGSHGQLHQHTLNMLESSHRNLPRLPQKAGTVGWAVTGLLIDLTFLGPLQQICLLPNTVETPLCPEVVVSYRVYVYAGEGPDGLPCLPRATWVASCHDDGPRLRTTAGPEPRSPAHGKAHRCWEAGAPSGQPGSPPCWAPGHLCWLWRSGEVPQEHPPPPAEAVAGGALEEACGGQAGLATGHSCDAFCQCPHCTPP